MEFIVGESRICSLLPCLFSLETPPAADGDDRYPAPLPARHLYLSCEGKAIFASSFSFPLFFVTQLCGA